MSVLYKNCQDDFDPPNGRTVSDRTKLVELLDARRKKPPFLAKLTGDNGFELMIGIAGNFGCVQHSPSNGNPPYWLAMSADPPMKSGGIEFLTANTPTPITARHIVRYTELRETACYFLETGGRSHAVFWEQVGAVEPDTRGPWRPRPYQIVLRFMLERWHSPRDDTNTKFVRGVRCRPDWQPCQPVEVCYLNHQDTRDQLNSSVFRQSDALVKLLRDRRKRVPFVIQLVADNELKLVLGIGSGVGFVQFRRIDGDLPYYMARPIRRRTKSRRVAFWVDDVPVPVLGRFILNFDEVEQIVEHFLATGERNRAFAWEPM